MAAPGHVAEDSTADLSTQNGRSFNAARQSLNAAQPVLSSETCPSLFGRACLPRQHSPQVFIERATKSVLVHDPFNSKVTGL